MFVAFGRWESSGWFGYFGGAGAVWEDRNFCLEWKTDPNGLFGDRMVFQKFFYFWILEKHFSVDERHVGTEMWHLWTCVQINGTSYWFSFWLKVPLDVFLFTMAVLFWQHLLFLQYLYFIHSWASLCAHLRGVRGKCCPSWAVRNSVRRLPQSPCRSSRTGASPYKSGIMFI